MKPIRFDCDWLCRYVISGCRVREAELLPPPALRTGRESFPSSGSSISKAVWRTRQQSYNLLAVRYSIAVDALAGKGAPVDKATDLCTTFSTDSSVFLVPRHRREVCPRARRVMLPRPLAQPVSAPWQDGVRFFPPPHTRMAIGWPDDFPPFLAEGAIRAYHVPHGWHGRVRCALCAGSMACPCQGSGPSLSLATVPFWRKPLSIFGWLPCTTFLARSHGCTLPSILVPSPPEAGRDTVPSRFGCQSGDCGCVVRGLLTARDLAAVPRRILLMAQQVWSVQLARQSTLRPRVADPRKAGHLVIALG